MRRAASRRSFLRTSTTAALFGSLAELDFLAQLPPVSAAEATPRPDTVRFSPEIEPLVRLIEDTPRERLIEVVADRIKHGLSYQQLLSAVQLSGVRSIEPRPLGFKFHAVLVVNSAHLASLASPDEHRWLPIFWTLDAFKSSQAEQAKQHAWSLPPARDVPRLPPPDKARQAFIDAMEAWDLDAADAAIVSLARSAGEEEVYDLLFRYGARDFRSIGHKPIFVANSRRTLDCIGWQHAEPVLRSLVMGLLDHDGNSNPELSGVTSVRSWRPNLQRVKQFPENWTGGRVDPGATKELLAASREAKPEEIGETVVELLRKGVAPQSIWDAILVGAGEVMLRERGFMGIHVLTGTNALHYAFQTCGQDETRRLLLLQGAALIPHMRDEGERRKRAKLPSANIELLEPLPLSGSSNEEVAEILGDISRDKLVASRKMLSFLRDHSPSEFIDAARLLIFFKGNEAHDYKFSSAVFEDYLNVSPAWRERYLAAAPFWLHGSGDRDNKLVERTRNALKA